MCHVFKPYRLQIKVRHGLQLRGKNIPQVPDSGTSQYWPILEYVWCAVLSNSGYFHGIEQASVILKLTILEQEYDPVSSKTRVPVSVS